MPAVSKVWHLLSHDRVAIQTLAKAMNVSPIIAQLLLNRGIKDPKEGTRFLQSPLTGLHPPTQLPGVSQAVERLEQAIRSKKKITIYGDYDVDGITGTAVLFRVLAECGANVDFYVPHRLEEGYGLNIQALQQLAQNGTQLVLTVDCGIASLQEALEAKRLGLELIISDHHEMKETLPEADVLVHPRLPDTNYPFGELSGSAVAFKLAWALAQHVVGSDKVGNKLQTILLDGVALATLGIIADVVPLHDENRIIVKHGLARINNRATTPLGLKALLESAKLDKDEKTDAYKIIRAEDIGYKIGPRINAAGRLGCARLVVEMLTTLLPGKAQEVAFYLENQNLQRQAVERRMTEEAKAMVQDLDLSKNAAVVLMHPEWHAGVIGIVASRMVEHLGRPVFLLAPREGGELMTGSGRSVHKFPLHEALKACEADLISHGGHAMAAGLKIAPDRIDSFRKNFNAYAIQHFPNGSPPAPRLRIDAEVPLSSLTLGLVQELEKLEPYGASNPKPRFLAGDLQIENLRRMGKGENHLSFKVRQGATTMRAVAFNMGDRVEELMEHGGCCSIAFVPKINEWNGYRNVEMMVDDFQAGAQTELG